MIVKIFWVIRALFYMPFFGKYGFPGYIGKPCFLLNVSKFYFGKKVRIFPGLRAEVHGEGFIKICDNVSIGQNAHITSGGELIIGKDTVLSGDVMITNIDHDFSEIGVPILDQKHIIKSTVVGENSFIGLGARIQAGTVLGKHCIVGTNSVVRGVFPDYSVIVGIPGRIIKQYDPAKNDWVKVK